MHTRSKPLEKRRICIFCQTWESGGIESFIYNVLRNIDITNFEVDLVVEELRDSVFTKPLTQIGVVFYELSGSTRCLHANYRMFEALMRERKYEVLHLNVYQAQAMMYLGLAKRNKIPIRIAHSHNTMLRMSKTRPLKMLIHCAARQLFSKNATDLWACSGAAAQFMFSKHILKKKAYHFVPNGIDLQRFQFDKAEREKLRQKLHLEDCFVIGNIGRLCYQKNQAFLLKIFAELQQSLPQAKILLIGDGDGRMELEQLAESLGISDSVIFYGVSNHVEKLLWVMDAFAFPSRFEGLGIVAIEAQAAGLPLICSDQVPEEAIVSQYAFRLTLDDQDVWIRTLANMCGAIRTDVSENERLSKFDADRVGRWIEKEYLR